MRDEFKAHLIEFEGIRLKPYYCSKGKLSLGIGRNLDDMGITLEEAHMLLDNDINNVEEEVVRKIKDFDLLPDRAKLVLLDMAFNMGVPTLLSFKKMLRAISLNDWDESARQLLSSRYAEQVGRRALYNAQLLETAGEEPCLPKLKRS